LENHRRPFPDFVHPGFSKAISVEFDCFFHAKTQNNIMDKILKYQDAIIRFLKKYANSTYADDPSDIETHVIIDKENGHFQLFRVGWNGNKHIHYTPIHIDVKADKVWIQVNNTEQPLGDILIEYDIPKEDIVLGFQKRELRALTGFAEA
jgi:hypothetical protein